VSELDWRALDLVPDALIVLDGDALPIALNVAARRLAGQNEGATGLADILRLAGADAGALDDAVRAVLGGLAQRVDLDCATTHDGEPRRAWISVTADTSGRGALVVHRDVTDRARAEREREDVRERLQALADATTTAVCLHRGGTIIDGNLRMRETFSLSPEKLLGHRVDALLTVAPGEDLGTHLGRADAHVFEATARRGDGTSFLVEVVSTPVESRGEPLWGLAIRDISAQRAAEHALRESEERSRLLAELSSEGLILTERATIFQANRAMKRMLGYEDEEIIGRSAADVIAPEDIENVMAHIRSGSDEQYECKFVRKDGTKFPALVAGFQLPYQGRVVRGVRMRDITEQKQAEEVMRRNIVQEEKLRVQAERLVEMSTPFIPITHEIAAMPLIGTMDADRANRALETMLEGIARSRAHTAIVDVTGVTAMDADVATSLVRLAHTVRLQGAQVVLTGIRPEMAEALVRLHVDLKGIVVKGSFQDGIRYAMTRGRAGITWGRS
jgi:rsbT co-antagonist protein RsbR